jgi:hypothetical protein
LSIISCWRREVCSEVRGSDKIYEESVKTWLYQLFEVVHEEIPKSELRRLFSLILVADQLVEVPL